MAAEELQTRDKILRTASDLFLARGYENTPVQAIIDAVGIAKGTFYHHFQGKEEMLAALAEGMTARVLAAVEPVAADPGLGAAAKLLEISRVAAVRKLEEAGPSTALLVRQMRLKSNRILAASLRELSVRSLVPLYARCIRQGVAEGAFRVGNPDLASELVVGTILAMTDRIVDLFLGASGGDQAAVEGLTQVFRAIEEAVERILGAPAGSLPIYTSVDLRETLARYTSILQASGGYP